MSTVNNSCGSRLDLRPLPSPVRASYTATSWGLLTSHLLPLSEGWGLDDYWNKMSTPRRVLNERNGFVSLSCYQNQTASSADLLLFLAVSPHVSWDYHGDGWHQSSQKHSCWQVAAESVTLHFSAAKSNGPQQWNQPLSWTSWKAQQFCQGPWLEELHVVLGDEARLSIQSPLQPARLLRWMHCTGSRERVTRNDVTDRVGGGCILCMCEGSLEIGAVAR